MSESIDLIKNPLDAMIAAGFAEDGRHLIEFASVEEAKSWAQRFFWAKERAKRTAKKEARAIASKAKATAQDFAWIDECNAQIEKMDEFHASRKGAIVTVMAFRKNTGIVAINGVPVDANGK